MHYKFETWLSKQRSRLAIWEVDVATNKLVQQPLHSSEAELSLGELRKETIELVLPLLYIASFFLAGNVDQFDNPYRGRLATALLALLPVMVWMLHNWDYRVATWALIAGCLMVNLLVVDAGNADYAITLLALPIGLAAVFVGVRAGAGIASICTLLLMLLLNERGNPVLRATALTAIWGILGLVWLALRPSIAAIKWSWFSHQRSKDLLEESRDYQAHLKQVLAGLEYANTQLMRLNRLTQSLREEAEDARAVKDQFVANISHELRTPLNMIIGFSEMIVGTPEIYGSNIPPALMADLDIIYRNSQHLSELIDDVLDLSQIEAGQMALTRERAALHEIIGAAVVAVRPLFESKHLYLDTEVPDDLPPIFCDCTRIRQVVLNLLSNSGRFTEHGGVRIRAWQEDTNVVVSVIDTGPGIASEDMDRVFQRFQQLDNTQMKGKGGRGLGLYISMAFIKLHGGKMWLESTKGAGTTFYFRLPIDPPATIEEKVFWPFNPYMTYIEPPHRTPTPAGPVRPRFVVVERGDSLQRLLTRYLDNTEIVPMNSLEEAIHHLSQVPAQALLVNNLFASATLEQLSGPSRLPAGIPAIVCAVPGFHDVVDDLGISGYLVKPVSRVALLAALDRLGSQCRTVLVVDDEPEALRLFRRMLISSSRGYQVLDATDGQQALGTLGRTHPDVVLLDLLMPNMDGFKFLAAKSEEPSLRDIPVVVISARDPTMQPVVSDSLAITQAGGLSARQLLECIQVVSRILSAVS